MPWDEKTATKLRMEFVVACESGHYSFSELCELFGVSRQTGYKWWRRFEADGIDGLKSRSHAPKSFPHQVKADVV
jgi:putative transposase